MLAPKVIAIAAALSGAAASPPACQATGVSCARARAVVSAWQNSTADPLAPSIRFRWDARRWDCGIRFEYGFSFNLAVCSSPASPLKRRVRFQIRWPVTYIPEIYDCRTLPRFAGIGVVTNVTKGIGCAGAAKLLESRTLPTQDAILSYSGWRCTFYGHSGNATQPNQVYVWCESLPSAQTSLTQAIAATLSAPTNGTVLCKPNGSLCTWGGLPPDSQNPLPPQGGPRRAIDLPPQ